MSVSNGTAANIPAASTIAAQPQMVTRAAARQQNSQVDGTTAQQVTSHSKQPSADQTQQQEANKQSATSTSQNLLPAKQSTSQQNSASDAAKATDANQSQRQSTTSSGAAAPLPAPQPPIAASGNRSSYKTFILSNGIFEVENRYVIREVIGQGAYGIVCSSHDLKNNNLVAVKKIENVFDHRSLAKRTLRELKLCRYFRHENILSLDRVMRPHSASFTNIYMVSELMETDLACVIRSPQELTDEHCQFFIYQVLRGLKFIHSAHVIHRDLKPRNLLVNSNCDLKICDFGLARVDDPENNERAQMSTYVATRWYRAPEVILGRRRYTKAVDMWSVGCILAELVGRKPIFPGRDSFHQIQLVLNILGSHQMNESAALHPHDNKHSNGPTDDYVANLPKRPKVPFKHLYPKASPLACDLLDKLLVCEPSQRLTVEEALRHPYLEELHCEEDEPVCTGFDFADFYFEYVRTTKDDLKQLIHREIVEHYKEEHFTLPTEAEQANKSSNKGALDNFANMKQSLPKQQQQAQQPRRPQQRRKSF